MIDKLRGGDRCIPDLLCICVDSFRQGDFSARVYDAYEPNPVCYRDLWLMFRGIDAFFDGIDWPHAEMKYRSFQNARTDAQFSKKALLKRTVPAELQLAHRGKCQTFVLAVETRLAAEWQGHIYSKGSSVVESFSGIRELCDIFALRCTSHGESM